jgi:hypothetical protein
LFLTLGLSAYLNRRRSHSEGFLSLFLSQRFACFSRLD